MRNLLVFWQRPDPDRPVLDLEWDRDLWHLSDAVHEQRRPGHRCGWKLLPRAGSRAACPAWSRRAYGHSPTPPLPALTSWPRGERKQADKHERVEQEQVHRVIDPDVEQYGDDNGDHARPGHPQCD